MQLRCLALFDWSPSIDETEFLRIGVNWFRSKSPNLGKMFVAKTPTANSKSVSEKKLGEMLAAKEKISSLEIYPSGPDEFSYYFCVSETENGARALTMTLPGEIFRAEDAEDFIATVSALGDLCYGMSLLVDGTKNPAYFVRGVTHGEPRTEDEEDESRRNSIWFMERLPMKGAPPKMRHKHGLLRDVYEINVLNESHTTAVVDGQDLGSWISESKVRGTLTRLSESNSLWVVPSTYVRHIRDSLGKNGLLLAYL